MQMTPSTGVFMVILPNEDHSDKTHATLGME